MTTVAKGERTCGKALSAAVCDRARRLYQTHDWNDVCELLNISSATLSALKNRDFQPAVRWTRPMPDDFVLVADGMTQVELMRHYKTTGKLISRWRKQAGYGNAKSGRDALLIPQDFAFQSRRLSRADLAVRYGVCVSTITRWRKVTATRSQDLRPAPAKVGWADTYFERAA